MRSNISSMPNNDTLNTSVNCRVLGSSWLPYPGRTYNGNLYVEGQSL